MQLTFELTVKCCKEMRQYFFILFHKEPPSITVSSNCKKYCITKYSRSNDLLQLIVTLYV